MTRLVLVGLSVAALASCRPPVALADAVMVLGVGQQTCAQFLDTVDTNNKMNPGGNVADAAYSGYGLFLGFADGYVTAHNEYASSHRLLDGGVSGRMRWLENYCRAKPLAMYTTALHELTNELIADGH